jgi:hypothetical protein
MLTYLREQNIDAGFTFALGKGRFGNPNCLQRSDASDFSSKHLLTTLSDLK